MHLARPSLGLVGYRMDTGVSLPSVTLAQLVCAQGDHKSGRDGIRIKGGALLVILFKNTQGRLQTIVKNNAKEHKMKAYNKKTRFQNKS